MSDAVMVPRAWLLKIVDTLKPFAEVAEKLRHCHVVEICEPHPDNPSPNIAVMPREWLERASDDLGAAVIVLHRDGALSEGQAAKLTGLDRVEVRKLSDALAASPSVGGWGEPVAWLRDYHLGHDDNPCLGLAQPDDANVFPVYAAPPPVSTGSRPQEAVPTEQADGGVVGLDDALDTWIVDGLKAADRRLSEIGPINACTSEDVAAGRVAAYQAGYQNGVKATLTDACYVIKQATPPSTPIAGGFGSRPQEAVVPTEPVADRWADLERLEGEAKPGPWEYTMGASGCPCIEDEAGRVVASYLTAEDAAFIAAARSSILELIAAARRDDGAGQ